MASNIICHLLGHKWKYKDYTNAIKWDGGKYKLTKVRKCMRCDEHEFKYETWVKRDQALPEDVHKI